MTMILLLLLLHVLVASTVMGATPLTTITTSDQRSLAKREVLYNLNEFAITFSTTHHEFSATGSQPSPFAAIKTEIASVTGWYLEQFMDNILVATGLGFSHVESVDLQVSSFRPSHLQSQNAAQADNVVAFKAEVYGVTKVIQDDDVEWPSRPQAEHVLNQLVRDAFGHSSLPVYIDRLRQSTDLVLASIVELQVETDAVAENNEPPAEQEETGGGETNGLEEPEGSGDGGSGWETKDFLLCFFMGGFLLISLGCLYMYASRQYHERKRYLATQHYLDDMDQVEKSSQQDDTQTNRYLSPNRPSLDRRLLMSGDPTHNGTNGDTDIVPVPAEDGGVLDGQTPRRYVSPASPFEVIYGAAFLHQDQVMEQQRQKRKRRSSSSSYSSRKSVTSTIRPMLSIAEEEQANGGIGMVSPSCSKQQQDYTLPSPGGISSWLGQWAGYLDGTTMTKSPRSQYGRDYHSHFHGNNISPTGVQEVGNRDPNVVYRDFPRHDGTPCLIYNPDDGSSSQKGGFEVCEDDVDSLKLHEVYIQDSSYHSTGSALSLNSASTANNSVGTVDKFVVKLENLMMMRQKRYRERVKMEQERVDYVKKRQERDNTIIAKIKNNNNGEAASVVSRGSSTRRSVSSRASKSIQSLRQGSNRVMDVEQQDDASDELRICLSPTETEVTLATDTESSLSASHKDGVYT